jgi:serpin B
VSRIGPVAISVALLLAARVAAADFDVAASVNQVGLDLYRGLATGAPPGNLALSPYSIESALAMVYAGADGETRAEMARALHFPLEDQPLQAAFAALRGSLDQVAAESARVEEQREKWGGHGDVIEWHAANRLFGQQDTDFRKPFLVLLARGYDAPLEPVDFKENAEHVRLRINAWVEDQTRKKIRDLIPKDGVGQRTRLVLVNALYLKAPWEAPFSVEATWDLPFYPGGGKSEPVPTMRRTSNFGYLRGSGYTAVAIPFQGGDLQFLILLPDGRDGLGRLAAELTPALLGACAHLPYPGPVALYLPKFRLEGPTIALAVQLQALGMKSAFDVPPGSANFDRAAPRKPDDYLAVSEIFHRTFIAVDEQGTEAAAATAVGEFAGTAVRMNPPEPVEVHVDHPFFFAIQHRRSGVCLFFGSVADPR